MQRTFGKRAAIVVAAATVVVALSASVALAAPVLPYGTTSAPGMSGTCTNCHTYAPAPTPAPVVTPPAPTPAPTPAPVVTPPATTPAPVVTPTKGDEGKDDVEKAATPKKHHHKKHPRSRAHHGD